MSDLAERIREALADRYRIERELGGGGMAVVFLARDLKHDRRVALKVLRPEIAGSLGTERFLREIRISARLTHPNILTLIDSGEADGLLYYVMPYVEGESLRERLEREGQLPLEEALRIAREVADAIAYAHDQGVLHRDIKPENILLEAGHAVVADFGIARAVSEAGGERLTRTGLSVGSPLYMSPEQAGGGGEVDARSDLYSLACVIYEMLAGEPPFAGRTAQAVLTRHMTETPTALRALRPAVPAALQEAVGRALAKAPADRFQAAAGLRDALAACRGQVEAGSGSGAESVPAAGRWAVWKERLTRRSGVALLVGGLLALATLLALWRAGEPRAEAAFALSEPAFVILPVQDSPSGSEESLAADAARELRRLLSVWEGARIVPSVALRGPMFDLGLQGRTAASADEAIAVARKVRAATVVTLSVEVRGDSAHLEAVLFDVPGDRQLVGPLLSSGPKTDAYRLVAPVAREILGLSGAPRDLGELRRLSRSPQAIREYYEGMESLERWELARAEAHFRAATAEDSTFALAHHFLAVTLYWQVARDANRLLDLGPEIAHRTMLARRHAGPLSVKERERVEAFHDFQRGDYAAARSLYHALLDQDSTDIYAWLLLGSLEYRDRALAADGAGGLAPRADWNLALRAFERTVELSPDFHLGYGHLFDIHRALARAALWHECPSFHPPAEGPLPPWEPTRQAGRHVGLCPLLADSIAWIHWERWPSVADRSAYEATRALRDRVVQRIERWSVYHPEAARPHEEWAAWLLAERAELAWSPDPERITRLAREALDHTGRALSLGVDTVPEDLIRLGVLHLAVGDHSRAAELTEEGLARLGGLEGSEARLAPGAAANVFLARGQPNRALEIVGPISELENLAVPDPSGGASISLGEAVPDLRRIEVYGGAGLRGPDLRDAVARVRRAWSGPRYSERESRILRGFAVNWIGPALAAEPSLLREWFAGLEEIPPLWRGFLSLESDPEVARRYLREARAEADPTADGPGTWYLLGLLARYLGDHASALELFGRLEARPLRIRTFDAGWGLRSLARLHRARSHEARGEEEEAVGDLERFLEIWEDAEPAVRDLVQDARADRARLAGGD